MELVTVSFVSDQERDHLHMLPFRRTTVLFHPDCLL